MRVRARVERLRQRVGDRPPTGRLDLVVAIPVGCGMADDLPPGVHYNADGLVATVVFEGDAPDPSVIAELNTRIASSALLITSIPDPRPGTPAFADSGSTGRYGQTDRRL